MRSPSLNNLQGYLTHPPRVIRWQVVHPCVMIPGQNTRSETRARLARSGLRFRPCPRVVYLTEISPRAGAGIPRDHPFERVPISRNRTRM